MKTAINYSRLDRLVHRLAFASPSVQLAAADIEDSIFGRISTGCRSIDRSS